MALNLWKPEKRRTGIVRMPPVVPGVALSRYTNTELGVRIARKSGQPRQDPGIAWARLMRESNRPEKDIARDAVLDLCGTDRFPNLSILTFPSSDWRFERALLQRRGEPESSGPHATRILSLERDIAIYRAACHNMPRGKNSLRGKNSQQRRQAKRNGEIRQLSAPSFASAATASVKIAAFFCCSFEDYATKASGEAFAKGMHLFDVAWLDFNGQLTPSRLSAIERYWNRQVRSLLVVTLLNLHLSDWMRGRIAFHGGTEHLLNARLAGSRIESAMPYGDRAPMMQITLRRESGKANPLWTPESFGTEAAS